MASPEATKSAPESPPICTARAAGVAPPHVERLLAGEGVRSVVVEHHVGRTLVIFHDGATVDASDPRFGRPKGSAAHAAAEGANVCCWVDAQRGRESYYRAPTVARGWRRAMHLAAAAITFALAALGVVLPGLPTTPFLLLTSYSLLRSSPQLHERLLRSRLFGGLLRDWKIHGGVRPGVRWKSIAIVAAIVGASLFFTDLQLPAKLSILAAAALGAWCIARLRVIDDRPSTAADNS